jgi:hypothetical protein
MKWRTALQEFEFAMCVIVTVAQPAAYVRGAQPGEPPITCGRVESTCVYKSSAGAFVYKDLSIHFTSASRYSLFAQGVI